MTRKVIGIDFGSSQSSVSIMEIGSTDTPKLHSFGGGDTVPTLLALDANDNSDVVAFGNKVRQHYRVEKQGTIKFASNFKRYLGRTPKPDAEDNEKNADLYCRLFLKELAKSVADSFGGGLLESRDYVTCIAHPATWDKTQVDLLKQYVEEAGFPSDPKKGIYTVKEPVAAMYALKAQQSRFRFGNRPEHYMVIDFGGGTLDICIIETDILGKTPEPLSTSGDSTLGGKDFDEIIEYLFFRNNTDLSKKELSNREIAELNEKFREAKEAFSNDFLKKETSIQYFNTARGQYSLTVSKQEFSNICRDRGLFEKIKISIHDALDKAHIDNTHIDKVVLTGGSSKWFFVQEIVKKELDLKSDSIYYTESPFTDVAVGCALSIARSDSPPKPKGLWSKCKIGENGRWSSPKMILSPNRTFEEDLIDVYLCTITQTRYLYPYQITVSFFEGCDSKHLDRKGDIAVLQYYARSNFPCLDIPRRLWLSLRRKPSTPYRDEYVVYLQRRKDENGEISYLFRVLNTLASDREKEMLTSNKPQEDSSKGISECEMHFGMINSIIGDKRDYKSLKGYD